MSSWSAGNRSRCDRLLQVGKHDNARTGLELALDLNLDLLADGVLRVIDHNHSPIGEITDALALVFALANDAQGEHFARQEDHP